MKRISELSPGDTGTVRQVDGSGAIRQRLLDMGILPDVSIEIQRIGPAGDPLWIRLGQVQLSVRRIEADAVLVATD